MCVVTQRHTGFQDVQPVPSRVYTRDSYFPARPNDQAQAVSSQVGKGAEISRGVELSRGALLCVSWCDREQFSFRSCKHCSPSVLPL